MCRSQRPSGAQCHAVRRVRQPAFAGWPRARVTSGNRRVPQAYGSADRAGRLDPQPAIDISVKDIVNNCWPTLSEISDNVGYRKKLFIRNHLTKSSNHWGYRPKISDKKACFIITWVDGIYYRSHQISDKNDCLFLANNIIILIVDTMYANNPIFIRNLPMATDPDSSLNRYNAYFFYQKFSLQIHGIFCTFSANF